MRTGVIGVFLETSALGPRGGGDSRSVLGSRHMDEHRRRPVLFFQTYLYTFRFCLANNDGRPSVAITRGNVRCYLIFSVSYRCPNMCSTINTAEQFLCDP